MPATDYSKLAKIYDLIVSSDEDISFFLEEAQKAGGPVLELMAGTRRVSVPIAESGVALTCVDSSKEMLADLRRKNAEKRLKTVGGRHVLRKSLVPPNDGEIVVALETEFDEAKRVVHGKQTFEVLDATEKLLDRLELPLRFALLGEEEFREKIAEHGFAVESLFGDYTRKEFDSQESPYYDLVAAKVAKGLIFYSFIANAKETASMPSGGQRAFITKRNFFSSCILSRWAGRIFIRLAQFIRRT